MYLDCMLTVIGEGLVDVVRRGTGDSTAHVGGSPLNVAIGLARLGHAAQFIGRFGNDDYGRMVSRHLSGNSVLVPLPADSLPTSVATAELDADGAASYVFDLHWELPGLAQALPKLLEGTTLVHTGSVAAMLQPGADSVLHAVEKAHPQATICYDPNCRPTLINDVEYARAQAEKFVRLSDVVKASDEDLHWLYPRMNPRDAARRWLSMGPALVVVTHGGEGPWAVCADGEVEVPAVSVQVADTVGAGDSFMAALICAVVDHELDGAQRRPELRSITTERLTEMLRFAAAAAAVTVSRAGANPPTRAEFVH